jgi:hypothetical protein
MTDTNRCPAARGPPLARLSSWAAAARKTIIMSEARSRFQQSVSLRSVSGCRRARALWGPRRFLNSKRIGVCVAERNSGPSTTTSRRGGARSEGPAGRRTSGTSSRHQIGRLISLGASPLPANNGRPAAGRRRHQQLGPLDKRWEIPSILSERRSQTGGSSRSGGGGGGGGGRPAWATPRERWAPFQLNNLARFSLCSLTTNRRSLFSLCRFAARRRRRG